MNPFSRTLRCILFTAILCGPARAEEPPLRELLRDGLYAEEVTRDPEAAAKQYEQVLSRYSEQRNFAAAALYRLAEVRRKQDRKEDAVKLYQQLLAEFPGAVSETKLARENLAALGGKVPPPSQTLMDEESNEIARLELLSKTSPDVIRAPNTLFRASSKGWSKVVEYLLAAGAAPFIERNGQDALSNAASDGNLAIVKQLLGTKVPVPAGIGHSAIVEAVESEREAILDFLLQEHIKPGILDSGNYVGSSIFCKALLEGKQSSAEILLKYGADLNAMSDIDAAVRSGKPCGTPLHLAIHQLKLETANWLLEKGAKPDIPDDLHGLTPLHHAADSSMEGCLELMARLLAAGANPNLTSFAKKPGNDRREPPLIGATPLVTAFSSNFKRNDKVRLLLKHGANPNVRMEAGGRYGEGLLLEIAVTDGNTELIKMLLAAGADPQLTFSEGMNLIQAAAKSSDEEGVVECLKLLADAGLKPDAKWAASRYEGVRRKALCFLLDRFIIPDLAEKDGVNFVMDLSGGVQTVPMTEDRSGVRPPDLGKWLLANDSKLNFTVFNGVRSKYQWRLWRKGGDGKLNATDFDISEDKPLPGLQWGDVVECRKVSSETGNYTYDSGLTGELRWSLRKRISFPITVEIDGKNRELTMRGDRVIFDPTKDELPLDDVQGVVEMLWQTTGYPEVESGQVRLMIQTPSYIVISRKDWPDVRLKYGSSEAGRFQLESGDRMKAEFSEEFLKGMDEFRKYVMTVTIDGFPFTRRYPAGDNTKPGILVPTLIQALVDLQVPRQTEWNQWAGRTTLDAAELSKAEGIFEKFTLMPHPDLSRIRIRRMQDGKEKVVEVDLAKAVSAMTADTTPEEARKADVMLQASDIVEISLKQDVLNETWKGLGDDESRFFALALSGMVQMVDGAGNVTFSEIDWRPVKFIGTEAGTVPVPEEGGVPSTRAWWLTRGTSGTITRGNLTESSNPSLVFLRDGDECRLNSGASQSFEPIPQPGQPRQARPRVVPPPTPSR
ncbi:MAG: ankyrin repeat domain-containing protein [Verrucomicrobiota bacterium]